MQIILHAGVHFSDRDRLLRGLQRNAEAFRADGVALPGPGRYRQLLGDAVHALQDGRPAPEAREVLLEAILSDDPDHVDRMVLSNPNFFGYPVRALETGVPYPHAEDRLGALRALFAGDEVELFLGLRNPASWLPALVAELPEATMAGLLGGLDPVEFRWSLLVQRLRAAQPAVPVTLWCNEDTPFIWGEVLRRLAGIPLDRKITGAFDMLAEIMVPEGMTRFRAFLAEHRNMTEAQKRRAMMAFVEKYAREDALDEELETPGWDAALIEDMSEVYEEDLATLRAMEGVTVVEP